jgi:hypothetical protein
VEGDGALAEVEPPRPVYQVPSKNYRLESDSKRDREADPSQGVPIGVFVRVPSGVFRYRLLWPDDHGFSAVNRFLSENHEPLRRADSLQRNMITLGDLAGFWPDSPFLKMKEG